MIREIIKIDEDLCDGCALCIPNCHEGALQIIDGKCRLVSDLFCDGLGACIGHCPQGALTIEKREAEEYDEIKTLDIMLKQSISTVKAHVKHLKEHGAMDFYNQAIEYLNEKGIDISDVEEPKQSGSCHSGGCPGSAMQTFQRKLDSLDKENGSLESALEQWPVQLHLVNPHAPYFKNKEIAIMSSCSAFSSPKVHRDYMAGRAVAIACPKLDYTDPYKAKLSEIFRNADTAKVLVVRMEVPCCGGLTKTVCDAAAESGLANIEVEEITLGVNGDYVKRTRVF
jgi:ferredoxin